MEEKHQPDVLGIVIMALPALFGLNIKAPAADIAHLGGALVVVVSVICMGEILRLGRYLNALLGLAIAILPWFTDAATALQICCSLLGLAVATLSFPRGIKKENYGLWDKFVR